LAEWLAMVGATEGDAWSDDVPPAERTLWNARVFPSESSGAGFHRWLWMYSPARASAAQKQAWQAAERRSAAEIALVADQDAFHRRRATIRAAAIRRSLKRLVSTGSAFSAGDLAFALRHADDPVGFAGEILALARSGAGAGDLRPMLIKGRNCPEEASRHGSPKRVFLRGGGLPGITQAAVGIMEEGFEAEPHSHSTMYENYYVLEGRAVYRVGDEEFAVEPGDMLIVPPGAVHWQRVTEGPHRVFYWGIAV
jgi:cupin domain